MAESSMICDLDPLKGTITLCNTGVLLKALSLLQRNPTQLKISEEELKLLQILNDGELFVKLKITSDNPDDPFYCSELDNVSEAYSSCCGSCRVAGGRVRGLDTNCERCG